MGPGARAARDGTGMDVYVDGKILESTGREIKLAVTVTDATGRVWFRRYTRPKRTYAPTRT